MRTDQVKSIAMIEFDILKGPTIEWKKNLTQDFEINIDQFCTPFYLMFQSGNGIKPRAIFFDNFHIVAFKEEMNLLLLFLENSNKQNYDELLKYAKRFYPKAIVQKPKQKTVKERMINVLREQQATISELRKYFKYNRKTIRRYLLDLVLSGEVKRDGKKGRETIWTCTD
ncbi:MAG: DUF977 family protein [Promethearchaeota archaeon]